MKCTQLLLQDSSTQNINVSYNSFQDHWLKENVIQFENLQLFSEQVFSYYADPILCTIRNTNIHIHNYK